MKYTRLLKIGSRGEDVKAAQRALHCYPDGIFGELTQEAVRQWQSDHKLVADGIVGIETWQSLFGALNADELQLHRSRRKITLIVVHSTATPEGKDYTVADIRKMHKSNGWSDIGYHYVIYRDGTLHEGRDVNISGGHARGYNSNSIGIVYIGGTSATEKDQQGHLKAKDTRTPEQKATLLRLIKDLRYNGPHFSKKLCEFAVGKMRKKDGRITPWSKAEVDDILKSANVEIENDNLHDAVFVANMCKADYYKSSIADKEHVARYIKDYLDDEDGYDGIAFNRWLADCARKGVAIPWDDVL